MNDTTYTNVERLDAATGELDVPFEMDEDAFRAFYDRTARPLWAYLARMTGDRQAADDLLQESFYRFLRARAAMDDEAHRRNYLFRIATNLVRDGFRRRATSPDMVCAADDSHGADVGAAARTERRTDLHRALGRLKRRERELLWLAYAQGSTHQEIGETLGLKTGSIKPLLFRARKRLADMLRGTSVPGGDRA
ncbi:MAG TPA: sigma-70 family RNA polymerase sigma factor [Vicinamibacterales bacterium]|nr:sigma-70 family RNA polymerase sigma factor [Vicinamibacterales bacterium]